jgi:RNA polymerase sigma-70 factor, ECF subfamily
MQLLLRFGRKVHMNSYASSPAKPKAAPWVNGAVVLSLAKHRAQQLASLRVTQTPIALSNTEIEQAQQQAALAALLQASARGDAKAFEQFYQRSARSSSALVRRIVGNSLCDDVLADAYFQAWREAARFDATRGSALAWLLSIARSRALDRLRFEKLRHADSSGLAVTASEQVQSNAPGPDALLEHLQQNSRLHTAMAQLSASERWVLGLAYYKDLSHSEIAQQTELPLGTVKSHLHRAQQKLRQALGQSDQTGTLQAL